MNRADFLRTVRALEAEVGVDPLPEAELSADYLAYLRAALSRLEEQAAQHWHGWEEDRL